MTAKSEDWPEDRPAGLAAALPVLLGVVAWVCFLGTLVAANNVLATRASGGSWVWQTMRTLAPNLLIGATAIWGLSRLKPSRVKTAVLSALLGFVALAGVSGTAVIVKVLVATETIRGPRAWQTLCLLAVNALMGVSAILGFLWLKPWKALQGSDEPIAPTTQRTNKLFWLMQLLVLLAMLALIRGADGKNDPLGMFSNRPVSPGIAIFAITSYVLAMAIGWWRYFTADEHARKANDFAKLVGARLFYTATPAWWVASRAGLLPQPNAMVLWIVVAVVNDIGQFWYRNR